MSENTSQGQGQGPGVQAAQNQPQTGQFQSLQQTQNPGQVNQGQESSYVPHSGQQPYQGREGQGQTTEPYRDPGAQSEAGQTPWQGQARAQENYRRNEEGSRNINFVDSEPQPTSREDEISAAVERALAKRDRQHAQETAKLRNQVPTLVVSAHGGGPGNDNHRPSWNLAEQEAAARGEHLDHWDDDED